jgi:hypothetical protein
MSYIKNKILQAKVWQKLNTYQLKCGSQTLNMARKVCMDTRTKQARILPSPYGHESVHVQLACLPVPYRLLTATTTVSLLSMLIIMLAADCPFLPCLLHHRRRPCHLPTPAPPPRSPCRGPSNAPVLLTWSFCKKEFSCLI